MIKDVKTYFQTVASRLSKAFVVEEFDTEQELNFWALGAEHYSRNQPPKFRDIVQWVDLLFNAPAHFVYVSEKEDQLTLFRRHVNPENLKKIVSRASNNMELGSQLVSDFQERIDNLETKLSIREEFQMHGMSTFTIGKCQHIPLFKKDELWGIYCVGPYVETPESINPRISIIGRILSNWFIDLYEHETTPKHKIKTKLDQELGELSSGSLNVSGLSSILLKNISDELDIPGIILLDRSQKKVASISRWNIPEGFDEILEGINADKLSNTPLEAYLKDLKDLEREGGNDLTVDRLFEGKPLPAICLLVRNEQQGKEIRNDQYYKFIHSLLGELIRYREGNVKFSEKLLSGYYKMLRMKEKESAKTYYHTPRMIAFCQKFGKSFGLEDDELRILEETARLHDIGYVGIGHFQQKRTIGVDIEHPLIGRAMVDPLPIDEDIKRGIATHHEWVDGSGTPHGYKEEQISWNGKIVGMFEFVVQFIESHHDDESKSSEEWTQKLTEELVKRADKQFDMVLIPTVTELVNSMGWKKCCKIGAGK